MRKFVWGADSETLHGEPHTLQFYSEDFEPGEHCIWCSADTAVAAFFDWVECLPTNSFHVVYCHNLQFDLPEFFWDYHQELIGGEFEFEPYSDWKVSGVYGRPTFAKVYCRSKKISILIVDSFAWFSSSLSAAADLFCPDLPKLRMPKGLGERKFSMRDSDFYDYAMRDAIITYHIGKHVQAMIGELDIAQPVSLADMAAKTFRRNFVQDDIVQTGRHCIDIALKSYHGGKNNVVTGAAPAWHLDVTALDISSAYPYAMAQLPSMTKKKLYQRFKLHRGSVDSVPDLGVYVVSGEAADCEWPVIFNHSFKPIHGEFKNICLQGYELNEAIASGEVTVNKIRGYYYDADKDGAPSAFRGYVEKFYHAKQTATDPIERHMYKILLNSAYGKFIQTIKKTPAIFTDADTNETVESGEAIAGPMFHPFIASAITAHTRAYIHQLEHAHKAIHTATDGIYTKYKRAKRVPMSSDSGLGSLQVEGRGDLLLLRNKCYILYGEPGTGFRSKGFENKDVIKYAKHGFQGSLETLERLVVENRRKYTTARPNRLKESLKRGLAVNKFENREYCLKIGDVKIAG
jgi:hypothetical protein